VVGVGIGTLLLVDGGVGGGLCGGFRNAVRMLGGGRGLLRPVVAGGGGGIGFAGAVGIDRRDHRRDGVDVAVDVFDVAGFTLALAFEEGTHLGCHRYFEERGGGFYPTT
jgi:hypothetical protein